MERVLRKLGKKEVYLATQKNDYDKLVSVSRIKSKINLTQTNVIEKAIREWKRMNSLLNSNLIKIDEELFFALKEEEEENNYENVQILSYDECADGDMKNVNNGKYLIELLVEKELSKNLDLYNELFWRIIFFRESQPNNNEDETYTYTVIFTVHHFICEAKYKYLSLLDLFGLIENVYKKGEVITNESPLKELKCLEDLFQLKNDVKIEFSYPRMPSFIDTFKAKSKSISNDYYYIKNLKASKNYCWYLTLS